MSKFFSSLTSRQFIVTQIEASPNTNPKDRAPLCLCNIMSTHLHTALLSLSLCYFPFPPHSSLLTLISSLFFFSSSFFPSPHHTHNTTHIPLIYQWSYLGPTFCLSFLSLFSLTHSCFRLWDELLNRKLLLSPCFNVALPFKFQPKSSICYCSWVTYPLQPGVSLFSLMGYSFFYSWYLVCFLELSSETKVRSSLHLSLFEIIIAKTTLHECGHV